MTPACALLPEHELAEVLVCRDQESADYGRTLKHNFVGQSRLLLRDVLDLVSVGAKTFDDCGLYALVAEERQAASSGSG